ncbi:hypothetical protein PTKIN_Ptkin13bG0171400 [Pterospermum kingtungense]
MLYPTCILTVYPPIIHRDISSKNVLLNAEYEACLLNFGIAKILNPDSYNVTGLAGTFGYVAPVIAELAYTLSVTENAMSTVLVFWPWK